MSIQNLKHLSEIAAAVPNKNEPTGTTRLETRGCSGPQKNH